MSNVRQFRNRKTKKINLLRWFTIGIIIGFIFAVITCMDSGGFAIHVIIGYPLICGFALVAFRKWIFRTLWI